LRFLLSFVVVSEKKSKEKKRRERKRVNDSQEAKRAFVGLSGLFLRWRGAWDEPQAQEGLLSRHHAPPDSQTLTLRRRRKRTRRRRTLAEERRKKRQSWTEVVERVDHLPHCYCSCFDLVLAFVPLSEGWGVEAFVVPLERPSTQKGATDPSKVVLGPAPSSSEGRLPLLFPLPWLTEKRRRCGPWKGCHQRGRGVGTGRESGAAGGPKRKRRRCERPEGVGRLGASDGGAVAAAAGGVVVVVGGESSAVSFGTTQCTRRAVCGCCGRAD